MTDRWDDVTFDDAIATVRDDAAPAEVAEAAASRVWQRISPQAAREGAVEAIRGCADVRALLPAHRRGELAVPRALLVEDHLRECAACRTAFQRPGERRLALLPWRPATTGAAAISRRVLPWAIAASVLVATLLSAWGVRQAFFSAPAGPRAAVQSVMGGLQRLSSDRTVAVAPGEDVGDGEVVRTARASRAVLRLLDGSLVEMSERAELSVTARGDDTTIRLTRGSIIVQAAKRRNGHLSVASSDCTVEVTGTVFSVNSGIKGSRVSVIEGQVRVFRGGDQSVLAPGDQWTTSAAMGRVPVREEIAWSGELDRHLTLLAEMKVLRERWKAVRTPGLRYESRLLRIVPAETVIYGALPNYGEALADAHRLFQERLTESAVLREWWKEADPARHGGPSLETVIEKVRSFADFLGDEVVLVAVDDSARRRVVPLLMAEVERPGLEAFLEGDLAGLDEKKGSPVRILGDGRAAATPTENPALFVLVHSGLMAVSVDAAALQSLAARFDAGSGGLDQTPFGQRIAEAYENGAGLLFAADLERITAGTVGRQGRRDAAMGEALHRSGLDGLRYFVVERKDVADVAHTQAVLAFAGPPRGIPSWLAAPAPMGSLEFVSPGAQAAAAFVVKSPALIFDDIVGLATASGDTAQKELAELESKLDLHIREDLAETLGGEVTLALDGPLLPTPAWKLVVEVYDPARLQASLQTIVGRANDDALRVGRPGFRLESEQAGGETFHAIRGSVPFEVHYAFSDGYLVAAGSRALVMKALRTRASGDTLARSAAFRGLFPADRDVNVSGLVYQNLAPTIGALLEAPGAERISPDRRASVESLARDGRPSLLCAYGEEGAIRVAGSGGLFELDTTDLALPVLLERLLPGRPRRSP